MNIHLLKKEEYSQAVSLSLRVFTTCNTADYNEEGLDVFKSFIYNEERMNELTIWGAYEADALVGVLAIREKDDHLSMFFIHPDYQRKGIGKKLFDYMMKTAKGETMTVNASTAAVSFYIRLGFFKLAESTNYHGLVSVPMRLERACRG